MSGASIPYHLRPNKYVDRRLFVEALEHFDVWKPVREAAYVSLGGWLLEDQRLIHDRFGTKQLTSIEADEAAYRRQVYNAPLGLMRCFNCSTGDFIDSFDKHVETWEGRNRIIWFDYASAAERQRQLGEIQALTAKLEANDVLRITMNASARTLGDWATTKDPEERQKQAQTFLAQQLNEYMPAGAEAKKLNDQSLSEILLEAIRQAVMAGLEGTREIVALPLCSFRYNDGFHQMMTVTIAFVGNTDVEAFEATTKIAGWPFATREWQTVIPVQVPMLSMKERLEIDSKLFQEKEAEIHEGLPYRFDRSNETSLRMFLDYVKHYSRYPTFMRINL